eukprot:365916-Chlamydomonas_euryale.AAC.6
MWVFPPHSPVRKEARERSRGRGAAASCRPGAERGGGDGRWGFSSVEDRLPAARACAGALTTTRGLYAGAEGDGARRLRWQAVGGPAPRGSAVARREVRWRRDYVGRAGRRDSWQEERSL